MPKPRDPKRGKKPSKSTPKQKEPGVESKLRPRAECALLVEQVVRRFGRLDIVVNNAAYQQEQKSILDIDEQQLNSTFRTNFFGYFFMVHAALPHLKRGAVILNTGSVTALRGN